jgi:hypothetical protein
MLQRKLQNLMWIRLGDPMVNLDKWHAELQALDEVSNFQQQIDTQKMVSDQGWRKLYRGSH